MRDKLIRLLSNESLNGQGKNKRGAQMSKSKLKCNVVTKEITPERAINAMYGSIDNFIQELRAEKYNRLNSKVEVSKGISKEAETAV